jgi:hypothetical protein
MLIYGLAAPALRSDGKGQFFEVGGLIRAAAGAINAPLRVKHMAETEAPDVGVVVDCVSNLDGLFVVGRVDDLQIEQMVRDRLLDRFSIAGRLRVVGNRIYDIQIEEISLTDTAGFPGTKFQIHDGDDEPAAIELRRRAVRSAELTREPQTSWTTKKNR